MPRCACMPVTPSPPSPSPHRSPPAGTAAARPFRIDGNRAIAPGIADDKGGVAVFLHAFKLLKATGFSDYERVTMVFNTDEERGSSGSRDLIRRQAQDHDAVLSG